MSHAHAHAYPPCIRISAQVLASIASHWSITMNVFAIRFGGSRHSGTLCGTMDTVSFAALIPSDFVVGACFVDRHYATIVALACVYVGLGHAAMVGYAWLDWRTPSGLQSAPPPSDGSRADWRELFRM